MTDILLMIIVAELGVLCSFMAFLLSIVVYVLVVETKRPQINIAGRVERPAGTQKLNGNGNHPPPGQYK
jgi:hypothetical protein